MTIYHIFFYKGYEERESDLAAIVTLASSLDYRSSKSSLKLLVPLVREFHIYKVHSMFVLIISLYMIFAPTCQTALCIQAEPAQALNVPAVPLGALLTMAFPLSSRPPYVFSWINHMISAEDMMHPKLLKKLILNNFCKCRLLIPI